MNFIILGFQEVRRKFQRTADRFHVSQAQPRLDKAEIHLGQLGWQQVDFPPEVERQIHAINAVELKQAEFSNRSAGIQGSLDQLQSQREQTRKEYEELFSAMDADLQPLLESREQARKPLAGLQQGAGRFERAIAALHEKFESSAPELVELKAIRPQTQLLRQQIIQLEDLRIGYDVEKEDLQRAHRKVLNEMKAATGQIEALDVKINEQNKKIADARNEFNAREKEFAVMIASLEHDKEDSQKHVDKLDGKKSSAYLAVGRCLADFNIAPRNQPDALQQVLTHRKTVRGHKQRIAESLEASSQTSRAALKAFYILVILFFAAIAVAAFLLKATRHASSGKPASRIQGECLFLRTRLMHSSMIATCAATRWSSANSDGVSMVNVRSE